jgi:hypothetical protein
VVPAPVIESFLHLRRRPDKKGTRPAHPEEGRLLVILSAMAATPSMNVDPALVTPEQQSQLERTVRTHLARQLDDTDLKTADQAFLARLTRRLLAATLKGDYATLLSSGGGSLDMIRPVILDPKKLADTVLLRRWGVGDLSDDGVEATPSRLRADKIAVHRGSVLVAEGLLAAAYYAEHLPGVTAPSLALARHVAVARLTAYAIESGLANTPMLFDLDRLDLLASRTDTTAQGHLTAIKALWPTLRRLSELGTIAPPAFLSRSERPLGRWHATQGRRMISTDTQPFLQLLGLPRDEPPDAEQAASTSTLPRGRDQEVPLPLLRSLMPEAIQRLDRQAGEVTLTSRAGGRLLTLRLPALPAEAGEQQRRDQDEQLAHLDAFSVVLLADEVPIRRDLLPPVVTLTDDRFLVGSTSVAARRPEGGWVFDDNAVKLVREIFGRLSDSPGDDTPLSDWSTAGAGKLMRQPPDTAPGASSAVLRLYVQMERDEVMQELGATYTRVHPDQLVWLQAHPGGEFRVVRGRSLLDNAPADVRIKLLVSGHGNTDRRTRDRMLSGRSARELADEMKRLMTRLAIPAQPNPQVERISLLSCALETPVAQRSFGREFSRAARTLGPVGMETTVYAHILVLAMGTDSLVKGTRPRLGEPRRQGVAGSTWIFRSDPVTGITSVRDKFPNGDEGTAWSNSCCAIVQGSVESDTSGRAEAFARTALMDRERLRTRFGEIVDRLRPAGMHLLPLLTSGDGGSAVLTYLEMETGLMQTREVDAASDLVALRAGIAQISSGLSDFSDPAQDLTLPGAHIDLLNVGLLALLMSDLASDGSPGDAYQAALWHLSLTQGGFQAGADAAAMVSAIRSAATQPGVASMSLLVKNSNKLSSALTAVTRLAQAGSIGVDVARLIDALNEGDRARVSQAAVQVGLDVAGLALLGLAAAADLSGAVLLAAMAEGLAVPLAGLSIAIAALERAVAGELGRLDDNLQPLRQINLGYDEPLRRVSIDPQHPQHRVLLVNGWAPMRCIDFVNGTVTFADVTVGATALHNNQLYWQFGGHRLHDWWVNDGAGDQWSYSRNGSKLDVWTLMRRRDRAVAPWTSLPRPLRDPNLVLALMTAPNVEVDFDRYSSSRAGGDFALLDDPLIEQMQENSNAFFVGDYVSSSSFAKSADYWRFTQKPMWLEVVLDEQSRMLALPSHSKAELDTFVFSDGRSTDARTLRPLDQSLVHVRLVGGGGRYTLAIPPDGTVRNPVRIRPSDHTREVWTFLLKGGLSDGGKPISFVDGGVAGVSIAGQEFHFEALHGAIIQVSDPLVHGVRLVLDLERKNASLVLTLPAWSDDLRPADALTTALRLLSQTGNVDVPPASFQRHPLAPVQLSSVLENGEVLSGMLDPATGTAMLHGTHHLLILPASSAGAGAPPAWKRYALNGGEFGLTEERAPVVSYDGGRHFAPVSFTYDVKGQGFARDHLAMTGAGKRELMRWLSDRPGWKPQALQQFLTEELAAGVELVGPEGGIAQPVDVVDFYYRTAESRTPTQGWTSLVLWERLDQLEQRTPKAASINLNDDPTLAHELVRAGLVAFRRYVDDPVGTVGDAGARALAAKPPKRREISAAEVAVAKQWLVLRHAQASTAYGSWSDLHPPESPLSLSERTRLTGLRDELLSRLARHQAVGGSAWIKLGDTPDASATLVHQLRDAGVDIRIDVSDSPPPPRAVNRSGPKDFYDTQEPSLRLFIQDLDGQLEPDAEAVRHLDSLHEVSLSDTLLLRELESLGHENVSTSDGAILDVPPRLLNRVRSAGLTLWRSSRDWRPAFNASNTPDALPPGSAATKLGLVRPASKGNGIDASTWRLWLAQAATQGLLLDAWYARHAVPGTPIEVALRESAADALRDRLIRLQDRAERSGRSAVPLSADASLNRQLLAALQRLLIPAGAVKVAGRDTAAPGDVVQFLDSQGASHYALMRRPDTAMKRLPRDPAALRSDSYWAYLGNTQDLGPDLRPRIASDSGVPVLDPASYFMWRRNDPTPVFGGVYLYQNPNNGKTELFRLRRIDHTAVPTGRSYGYFPINGSSDSYWLYLGNSESLSTAELGELAERPSTLKPPAFSTGLLAWWTDRLMYGSGDYRNFRLGENLFLATTWGATVFMLKGDQTLSIELDDDDVTPFRVGYDAEFASVRGQFQSGQIPLRLLLIQGNGRPVDLDGAWALGVPEIVILDEVDGAPRHVDLDDDMPLGKEIFYEGLDLVIHRVDDGRLIRIRNALAAANDLPADDEWMPRVRITDQAGTRELAWPAMDQSLRLPMLTLHGSQLEAVRESTDLQIRDAEGWSHMRIPGVFASDGGHADGPSSESEALLRFKTTDGRWREARLPAPLIQAMAEHALAETDTASPVRWTLVPESDHGLASLRPDLPLDRNGQTMPQPGWPLTAAKLFEAMATLQPANDPGLAPRWVPADGATASVLLADFTAPPRSGAAAAA